MSKHFTSLLRLVADNRKTALQESDLASKGLGSLAISHTSGSKTVSLPQQPRPLSPAFSGPTQVNFSFDRVFDEEQSEANVYRHSVKEVVENVLLGYHGTVISFSTQQAQEVKVQALRASNRGAIKKASEQIFRCLIKSRRSKTHSQACSNLVVLCSFVIIINENVHDLLFGYSPEDGSTVKPEGFGLTEGSVDNLDLVHVIPPKLSVVNSSVTRASQQEVKSAVKVSSLLSYGTDMERKILEAYRTETNKTGGITASPKHGTVLTDSLHAHHTMCTITVEYAQFGTMNAPVSGNLSFIEVASSDPLASRQKHTKGDHITKEMVSLFNFADTINSLTSNAASLEGTNSTGSTFNLDSESTVSPCVPSVETASLYNDSILMQLLKESMGGNCKTLLLSHVPKNISIERYTETYEILKLASRARVIQNNPNKKDLAEKALMSAYMRGLHDMYGQTVSAKEEKLKPQKKRIVLTSATSPIATSPPPSFEPGMGTGRTSVMSGSKDSILSDDIDTAYNEMIGMTQGEERQRNMEMAATALVAAALHAGDNEAEGEEDGEPLGSDGSSDEESMSDDVFESESSTSVQSIKDKPIHSSHTDSHLVLQRPQSTKVKLRRKTLTETDLADGIPSLDEPNQTDDVGVDALITILQDPDTGVPRPSAGVLKDVRLRNDVGAIFSGAAIVAWMIANVDGVESEREAISLGELLLRKGALVHSEGSMVFANAESLFYYARQGRPTRRTLSQQEIQAMLARSKLFSTLTVVSESEPGVGCTAGDENRDPRLYELTDGEESIENATSTDGVISLRDPRRKTRDAGKVHKQLREDSNNESDDCDRIPVFTFDSEVELETQTSNFQSLTSNHFEATSLPVQDPIIDELITTNHLSQSPNHSSHPQRSPEGEEGSEWVVSDIDGGSPKLGLEQKTGPSQLVSGEDESAGGLGEEEVERESADGLDEAHLEGHTHSDRSDCSACQQEKGKIAREEAELLNAQEIDSSDPNTAPVEHIPTVQTLESTENYPHPLHMAVAIGKSSGVVRQLVMMFGVNKLDDFKRTPLMFAALGNNKGSSCSTLIECGADVNRQDISGLTALHVASYHGHKAAANVIINKGGLLDIIDATGHSALHWSTVPENHSCLQLLMRHAWKELVSHADRSGLTALHWAIHFNRPQHLSLLLKKYGDPCKLDSEGRTLVTYALEKEALPCIKVLITAHPSLLTFPDANQSTPLHHASAHNSPDSLLTLLTHKLRKKDVALAPSVNCTNSYQRTPLHCAVAYNSLQNVTLLLSNGAGVQLCDNEGKNPIDYARELEEGGEEILAVLEGQCVVEAPSLDVSTRQRAASRQSSKSIQSKTVSSSDTTTPSRVCRVL